MKRASFIQAGLSVALVTGVAVAFVNRDALSGEVLQKVLAEGGVWATFTFVAVYVVATVFFLPGAVLTLAGGAFFGPALGALYSLTGATLGATLAFLIARYLGGDWVARRAGGRLRQVIKGVEAEGWHFVAFVRLVPLFPFNLVNYMLGLTCIRLRAYILTSAVCMLPGALAYAWLGYAGREAIAGADGAIRNGLLALGLVALLAFLPRLARQFRSARSIGDAGSRSERVS